MEVIRSPEVMRRWTMDQRSKSPTIGLVPTMGALHEGHLSLARASARQCETTIASIFVNPAQFGPSEDLDQYPRTLDRDLELLGAEGVTAVFVPDNRGMYPAGFSTFVDPPDVAESLEGVWRPNHFRGVTTIVAKLFLSAPVTHAFFGRKDYQQWKVIEAMTRDLNMGVEIVACEIVREQDGLALSSRNRYLSDCERERALLLSKSLARVEAAVADGVQSAEVLESLLKETLSDGGNGVDKIEYAVVVDGNTLSAIDEIQNSTVALIAARVGKTRLIDNRVIVAP
jgi:pantoate--beta-alanine ligase